MEVGKRTKKIDVRFNEDEYQLIVDLEKTLGISKTEIIRTRVLNRSSHIVVNAKAMIEQLDQIGTDLGRTGNNINQLARYANILNKRGLMSPQIAERFDILFEKHIQVQTLLEVSLRKVIRLMGK